jgi:GntP family gluconate:H+ symporter
MNSSIFYVILLFLAVAAIVLLTTKLKVHPFLALLFAAIGFGIFSGMPLNVIIESINDGFGGTLGKIGLVIIIGVIIGEFLEKSGGAFAMAEQILKLIGRQRVAAVMTFVGWIVSIPVFADSGYIILSPLNKSLTKRAGVSLAGTAVALALGLMASHCVVPPTPGPIAAAGILNADLGLVILFGVPISFLAALIGLLYATKVCSKTYIDPAPDVSDDEINERLRTAPNALKSFIPILLPIVLIVIKSIIDFRKDSIPTSTFIDILSFIGQPVIALLIGMLISFTLPKKLDRQMLSTTGWVGHGLTSAAIIILITGAGGVFGKILQNSPIADVLGQSLAGINMGLWLPFLISAALKTAQGSSTVAIITTASLVSPMLSSLSFDTETQKALVVIAIGAGSMVVSHVNDSFFWIVTQVNGIDVQKGFRLYTTGTLIVGVSVMITVMVISWFV